MSDTKVLPHRFSLEEAEAIYTNLADLHVSLDADPLQYGPKRLNNKIAKARQMLDQCEQHFNAVAQRLHGASRALRVVSTDLELAKMEMFAGDPETRAGRSVGDREAIATGKLMAEVTERNRLDLTVQDLEAVMVVIKAKRVDLKDILSRLRDQIKLCAEERGLGARWGSKVPGAAPLVAGAGIVVTAEDIEAVQIAGDLDDLDGDVHLPSETYEDDPEGLTDLLDEDDEEGDDEPDEGDDEPDEGDEASQAAGFTDPCCAECGGYQLVTPEGLQCSQGHKGVPSITREAWEDQAGPGQKSGVSEPDTPPSVEETTGMKDPHCSVCGEPQSMTSSGVTCSNGHGGSPSCSLADWEAAQAPPDPAPGLLDGDDLSGLLEGDDEGEGLVDTTTGADVDDFLDDPIAVQGSAKIQDNKAPRASVELDEGTLDDLLKDFESED